MNVVIYNRDFTGRLPLPKGFELRVQRYSKHMKGGPKKATLLANVIADRWELKKLLRCPVEIYGTDGKLQWWGFINRVNIPNGDAQRVGVGLDNIFNYVTVAYADGITTASSDTASLTEYGQKESRLSDGNANQTEAEQKRDLYLADHKSPRMEFEFSGGSNEIVIECFGWYSTLGWKYYANTSTTNVDNATQISAIVTDAGQFFAGSIIENSAGITSNPYRDDTGTALTYIEQLLDAGTSNVRPLLPLVDKHRYLHIYERTAEPSNDNVDVVMREDNRLETRLGDLIPAEDCTVAQWGRLQGAENFPPFFIESADYDVDRDETTYKPAEGFEQIRLAKFIAQAISGQSDGSGGGFIPPIYWTPEAAPLNFDFIMFDIDRSGQPDDDFVDISSATNQRNSPVSWSNGPGYATIYFLKTGLYYCGAKFSLVESGAGPTDTWARMFPVSGLSDVEGLASVELTSTDYSHVDIGSMVWVQENTSAGHPRVGFAYALVELVKIAGTSGTFDLYNSHVQIVRLE